MGKHTGGLVLFPRPGPRRGSAGGDGSPPQRAPPRQDRASQAERRAAVGRKRGRRCREGDRETVTHCGWAGLAGVASARRPAHPSTCRAARQAGAAAAPSLPVSGVIEPNCAEAARRGRASSGQRRPSQPARLPGKLGRGWPLHPGPPAGLSPAASRFSHGLSGPEPNPLSIPMAAPEINLTQSCPLALKALFGLTSPLNRPNTTGSSSPWGRGGGGEPGPRASSSTSNGANQVLCFLPFYEVIWVKFSYLFLQSRCNGVAL